MTIKSILALKWASTSCPNAKFVVKMDDDVFLNPGNLVKFIVSGDSDIQVAGYLHSLDAREVVR